MNDSNVMGAGKAQSIVKRAQKIGNVRVSRHQMELANILQDAVPDGDVEIAPNGRVILRGRRLFARMMRNEKLRSPSSFLNGVS